MNGDSPILALTACPQGIASLVGLDLGTLTGWASQVGWQQPQRASGTWTLWTPRERRVLKLVTNPRMFDLRVYRLWENLNVLLAGLPDPTLVVFEDVLFSVSTAQTQLWASLRAAVWLSDAQFFDCVPVPTLKKFATQHGNATKQLMGRCAKRCGWDSWSRSEPDDNEVDAVFALLFAEDKYGKAS